MMGWQTSVVILDFFFFYCNHTQFLKHLKGKFVSSELRFMQVISVLGRLRQGNYCEFEAGLGYIVKPCGKERKNRL